MSAVVDILRQKRRRTETGAAALVMTIFIAALMVPLSALAVDTARLYVELERIQAAADAAATAGVTYMPDDFTQAKARALDIAGDNGFPHGGNIQVNVVVGDKPTQLKVTVSSRVSHAFASAFGLSSSVMSRTAVADFNGPAPMGSPCNTFANEPAASTSQVGYGPAGSQLKQPTHANCAAPQFWGSISGPETMKDQGSQFETRKCQGGEDGCTGGAGGVNTDFDPRGFIYMVRINAAAIGQPVRLQIYDPAYVETGSECTTGPVGHIETWDHYRYPYATGDANQRYDDDNDINLFCTGDSDNQGKRFGSEVPTVTSFALRSPVDSLNPYAAPATNPSLCTAQFPGYSENASSAATDMSTAWLRSSDSTTYKSEVAKVFHQWVDLCTFTPSQAGDWYIHVRNNVALPSSYTVDATGAVRGSAAVVDQAGDDTNVKGNGTNSFAIRAISGAPAGAVSVAPWQRMRIYANADSANTVFNLVRVVPAAAGKTLVVTYFDVGEATGTSSGSVHVQPPGDAKIGTTPMTTISGCAATGPTTGPLADCKVSGITPGNNNGKTQVIRVPIPSNYTCEVSSQGGCWFKVAINFPGSKVHDATTWTAAVAGEPVRLIE